MQKEGGSVLRSVLGFDLITIVLGETLRSEFRREGTSWTGVGNTSFEEQLREMAIFSSEKATPRWD